MLLLLLKMTALIVSAGVGLLLSSPLCRHALLTASKMRCGALLQAQETRPARRMMLLLLLKMMTLKCPYPLSTSPKSSHGYCLLAVSLNAALFSCSCALHVMMTPVLPGRSNRAACDTVCGSRTATGRAALQSTAH